VRLTSRDKDVALDLLDAFALEHRVLSSVGRGTLGLARELAQRVWSLSGELRRGGADVVTAIGGGFIAPAGRLAGVPSVVWTDTEHVATDRWLSDPWATVVCTPDCFRRDIGRRQVRYRGLHELAYLHPRRFTPDPAALADCGLSPHEPFAVVRFVSWGAGHDVGHGGLRDEQKQRLVAALAQRMRVVITSEAELPPDLLPHRLEIGPQRLHDLLAFARLCVGEGATLASEAAVLGVPAVYVSTLAHSLGYLEELARSGLVALHTDGEAGVAAALSLAADPSAAAAQRRRRDAFLADRVDVVRFVSRAVEVVAEGTGAEQLREICADLADEAPGSPLSV
jgi:predicted glycosyltransferase